MRFISCDWGTTHFRLRWIGGTEPLELCTDEGASRLAALGGDRAAVFHDVLERGLARLGAPQDLPVVISGMASSTIGWRELPYARVPFSLDGRDAVWQALGERVVLVSGLCSDTDIVRGEETQALGVAACCGADLPDVATLILPGTHSKHLTLRSRSITAVRTFMTGELFEVLARHSVLRHTTEFGVELDPAAFAEGVDSARRAPVTAALFRVRTRGVLDRQPASANTAYLSGLLVGAELLGFVGEREPLLLAASGALQSAYTNAARVLGLESRLILLDAAPLTARGQEVLLERIQKS